MLIIQMHRGTSIFSRLIKWFTRAEYSHVSMWFYHRSDPHGSTALSKLPWTEMYTASGFVLEAVEGEGVRELSADHYRSAREAGTIRLYTLKTPLTVDETHAMVAELRRWLGAKYDWLGVFKFVTRMRHEHDDKWFCSEYLAHGLAHVGRPLLERTEAWEVKPGDVPRSPHVVPCDNPETI